MDKETKLNLISRAYTTMQKNNETIHILDTDVIKDMATQNAILNIQRNLEVDFELSYKIMANACDIISKKTLNEDETDINSLYYTDLDFYADADGNANVYTAVQLSYLNIQNESEISEIMKDESIESIAQACTVWYIYKVAEACEALKDYILQRK